MSKREKEPWESKRPKAEGKLPPPPPAKEPAKPLVNDSPHVDLAQLTIEDLLRYTGALIVFDPGKLYRTDGSPVALDELDRDTRIAIAALEVSELYEYEDRARVNTGILKKIRQYDRIKAIELYAELKGWKAGKGATGDRLETLREYLAAVRDSK